MECFCGCGVKIRGRRTALNLQAAEIALELLAWDKARAAGYLGSPPDADLELLIETGAETYRRLLRALHGEDAVYEAEDGERWLKESAAEREDRQYMTKPGGLLKPTRLRVTEEDREHLDRVHPELSFSARSAERAADGEISTQLERLGALHREGVLTDEEFNAARDRVLSRD